MSRLEPYLASVEKARFLLLCESGADPRVLYRYDSECGCLLVDRVLGETPAETAPYGSVLFTLSAERRPLPAVLGCPLRLCPGSIIWCVPAGVALFSQGEPLLLAEPDRSAYPALADSAPTSPETWSRLARVYAETIAETGGAVSLGGRAQAEELVEQGLRNYRLRRHTRLRNI